MAYQPPSPTSDLKWTFEDLQLTNAKSRKRYQCEDDEEIEHLPEFHLFTLLPTELRLKIYTLALPGPRIIPIHYTSSTSISTSLSRTPSPSPCPSSSPYQPTHKRICRSPTSTSHPKSDKRDRTLAGCTSPARIPALLHTCRESRCLAQEHYTLSFRLAGPKELFIPQIWFSIPSSHSLSPIATSGSLICSGLQMQMQRKEGRQQDILYFPSLPGYCASFKHYTTLLSLLPVETLSSITRLAVHEDLFLEEGKRRASLDSGVGMCDGHDSGFGGINAGGGSGVGRGVGAYWNTDDLIEERLLDFWRSVGRKFGAVEEVWIIGNGREDDILSAGLDLGSGWEREGGESGWLGSGMGSGGWKSREGFAEMVGRVLGCVEEEMGGWWCVPRWLVLRDRE